MQKKKIIFYFLIIILVFLIYNFFYEKKINYVNIGDSLAEGRTAFGEIGYSYADNLINKLKKNNILGTVSNDLIYDNYRIINLINDLENNKNCFVNNKLYGINSILRESNILTISIGINDFINDLNINNSLFINNEYYNYYLIDKIMNNMNTLFDLISKYAKGEVYVLGIYNPFPYNKSNNLIVNKLISYYNNKCLLLCNKYKYKFLDISFLTNNYNNYFINSNDFHINSLGYYKIYEVIIDNCESCF